MKLWLLAVVATACAIFSRISLSSLLPDPMWRSFMPSLWNCSAPSATASDANAMMLSTSLSGRCQFSVENANRVVSVTSLLRNILTTRSMFLYPA